MTEDEMRQVQELQKLVKQTYPLWKEPDTEPLVGGIQFAEPWTFVDGKLQLRDSKQVMDACELMYKGK